jgi:hypothetical protein
MQKNCHRKNIAAMTNREFRQHLAQLLERKRWEREEQPARNPPAKEEPRSDVFEPKIARPSKSP